MLALVLAHFKKNNSREEPSLVARNAPESLEFLYPHYDRKIKQFSYIY